MRIEKSRQNETTRPIATAALGIASRQKHTPRQTRSHFRDCGRSSATQRNRHFFKVCLLKTDHNNNYTVTTALESTIQLLDRSQ